MDNSKQPVLVVGVSGDNARTNLLAAYLNLQLRKLGIVVEMGPATRAAIMGPSADEWTLARDLAAQCSDNDERKGAVVRLMDDVTLFTAQFAVAEPAPAATTEDKPTEVDKPSP